MVKTYKQLVAEALTQVREVFPWDLQAMLEQQPELIVVDIREPAEVATGSLAQALHIPRGILESACEWGYSDTVPVLVQARQQPVILVCRSGNRSALAALSLQQLGYEQVFSLKTGIRGWNDYELPLMNQQGELVDGDVADQLLNPPVITQASV
ncbi:MAG TPA: rhodanese-like domain-containing protein [Thiolinea sp.]|nr:rhodanese-like domain-containing protein [Thiolinea sp.]